jgi:hypothetical protein
MQTCLRLSLAPVFIRPQALVDAALLLVSRRDDHLLDALPFILHRERGGRCGRGRRREGSATGRAEADLASEQPCLTTEQARNGKNRRPSDRDHDFERSGMGREECGGEGRA